MKKQTIKDIVGGCLGLFLWGGFIGWARVSPFGHFVIFMMVGICIWCLSMQVSRLQRQIDAISIEAGTE